MGFIGCGGIAAFHLAAVREVDGIDRLHLCDLDVQAAGRLASQWAGPSEVHADYRALLDRGRPSVVHVLTPPMGHREIVEAALLAGANVLVEKPFCESHEDAMMLMQLAEGQGLRLCVDYSLLFTPVFRRALDLIAPDRFGDVVCAQMYFGHAEAGHRLPYGGTDHWAYRMRGGVLRNLACHPISVLLRLLGVPRRLEVFRAAYHVLPAGMPDTLQMMVEAESGMGSLMVSMAHGNGARSCMVRCEGGTIEIDFARQLCVATAHGGLGMIKKTTTGLDLGRQYLGQTMGVVGGVLTGRVKRNPGLRSLVKTFYQRLRIGGPPCISKELLTEIARIDDACVTDDCQSFDRASDTADPVAHPLPVGTST